MESSKSGRLVKTVRTLTRVFKTKLASETTRQRILQLEELERRCNEEVRLRQEADEALAKEKKELEVTKLLLLSYKEEQDKLQSRFKTVERKHEYELRLRKDTEVLLAIEQEKIDKLKTLESKYIEEQSLKKALMEENQELVEAYNRALMLVQESSAKQMINSQPPSSFICPISQEVMKDPQLTADGYTYEAEAIKKWLNAGHDTSPMTNLKLSRRDLVPNRALQSAIQDLVRPGDF